MNFQEFKFVTLKEQRNWDPEKDHPEGIKNKKIKILEQNILLISS